VAAPLPRAPTSCHQHPRGGARPGVPACGVRLYGGMDHCWLQRGGEARGRRALEQGGASSVEAAGQLQRPSCLCARARSRGRRATGPGMRTTAYRSSGWRHVVYCDRGRFATMNHPRTCGGMNPRQHRCAMRDSCNLKYKTGRLDMLCACVLCQEAWDFWPRAVCKATLAHSDPTHHSRLSTPANMPCIHAVQTCRAYMYATRN
jgi:hypothetical protein